MPATRITLTDSRDGLGLRLYQLTAELRSHATIPTTLKPRLSSLLEKVASRSPDLDVWTAVAELLEAPDPIVDDAPSVAAVDVKPSVARYLKKDWTNKFIGNSVETLRTVIRNFECQKKYVRDEFYSRTLIFLQSSGVGKSRLADTFGQSCPMINYVLREKGAVGFPPADDEILLLMQMNRRDQRKIMWHHSLAVGVLQASFEELYKWVEKSSPQSTTHLAALRHKEMAYTEKRIKFCQDVAKRAKEIAIELVEKNTWREVFYSHDSYIRLELANKNENHLGDLWNAAKKLTKLLRPENVYDPLLVVVFDEASSLLKEPGERETSPGRYFALNRIMSCLREYRIWFFIISTESHVRTIVPPEVERSYAADSSLRYVLPESEAQLRRIPPFLAFPPDIEDTRRMQDSTQEELGKSLSDFGKPKHMAMFGRRLWYAYVDVPEAMDRLAKEKLIGGVWMGSYQPHNQHHVFAALSFRLSLEACLHNSMALPLIRTAINSHMRVVISVNQDTGTMLTLAPSEPILAKAAMEYLCTKTNWSTSITLVTKLIEEGLIEKELVEKGLKGEPYARLVVTLAHDWVRYRQGQQASGEADGELQKTKSDGELQKTKSDGGLH